MKPICVEKNGTKYWYLNGYLHREDGPAIEYSSGTNVWYLNDKIHREDGPAVENYNGTKMWYLNNQPYTLEDYEKEITDPKYFKIFKEKFNLLKVKS